MVWVWIFAGIGLLATLATVIGLAVLLWACWRIEKEEAQWATHRTWTGEGWETVRVQLDAKEVKEWEARQ